MGLVTGIAGSIMSFADAKKQRENQVAAQLDADRAMAEAGRSQEETYMRGIRLPLEANA